MDIRGKIHSIESMGTVDGPGIRYVVFLQGCPLRCVYCHNRDTWSINGGREATVEEIIHDIQKYILFISLSGGGITLTGGEPTLQPEFAAEILKRCKEMGIHTALDTSGFADINAVKELLKYTDLVLLDIKHAVDEKHKKITGVSGKKSRDFGKYVSDMGIDIWIRYVLVPGLTDDEEELKAARAVITKLKTVKRIEVLPYHSMGKYKWEYLNEKYELKDVCEPTAEQVQKAQKILEGKYKFN